MNKQPNNDAGNINLRPQDTYQTDLMFNCDKYNFECYLIHRIKK